MLASLAAGAPAVAQDEALAKACAREASEHFHDDRLTCIVGIVGSSDMIFVIVSTSDSLLLQEVEVFETRYNEAERARPPDFDGLTSQVVVIAGEQHGNAIWSAEIMLPTEPDVLRMAARQWVVRRQSSSGICHVQLTTASPLGSDLGRPHDTEKAACEAAKARHEAASTASDKCSGFGAGTVSGCTADGVALP